MDIRDRVMGNQPQDFLHKIAGMVPGYNGYADKDKRRDADKLLRTELAKRYTAQRERINRAQQMLVRARHFEQVAEIDRIVGVFQRFIDRLNTATYGYTGLFDPVKVEAGDLDQIYAFDMALAGGVDQVSSAIDAVESAVGATDTQELPAALSRLSNLVDELNTRLNQRSDYLTSGRAMPQSEYKAMVSGASGQGTGSAGVGTPGAGAPAAEGDTPRSPALILPRRKPTSRTPVMASHNLVTASRNLATNRKATTSRNRATIRLQLSLKTPLGLRRSNLQSANRRISQHD